MVAFLARSQVLWITHLILCLSSHKPGPAGLVLLWHQEDRPEGRATACPSSACPTLPFLYAVGAKAGARAASVQMPRRPSRRSSQVEAGLPPPLGGDICLPCEATAQETGATGPEGCLVHSCVHKGRGTSWLWALPDTHGQIQRSPSRGTASRRASDGQWTETASAFCSLPTAEVYIGIGKPAEATACTQEAANLFPMSHNVLYMRGQVAELRGNMDEARRWYEEALSISPTHVKSMQRLVSASRPRTLTAGSGFPRMAAEARCS